MSVHYPEHQEFLIFKQDNQSFLFFCVPEIRGIAYIYCKTYPKRNRFVKWLGFPKAPIIQACGYLFIANNEIQVKRDENAPPEFTLDIENLAKSTFSTYLAETSLKQTSTT